MAYNYLPKCAISFFKADRDGDLPVNSLFLSECLWGLITASEWLGRSRHNLASLTGTWHKTFRWPLVWLILRHWWEVWVELVGWKQICRRVFICRTTCCGGVSGVCCMVLFLLHLMEQFDWKMDCTFADFDAPHLSLLSGLPIFFFFFFLLLIYKMSVSLRSSVAASYKGIIW